MNKITLRRSVLLGMTLLALAGCASKPELSRIHDPEVDFRAYKTFAFIQGGAESHSIVERRLMAATRSQLERRGLSMDLIAPDLLVNVAAVVEMRPAISELGAKDEAAADSYKLGRLAIDLFDTHRREVVWHSAAEGKLSSTMMRDVGSAAETAVAAVFDGFPVKPASRVSALVAPTSF